MPRRVGVADGGHHGREENLFFKYNINIDIYIYINTHPYILCLYCMSKEMGCDCVRGRGIGGCRRPAPAAAAVPHFY
jgi:hypothetical protein